MKEKDKLEDVDISGKEILQSLKCYYDGNLWTGFVWLRVGTGVRVLHTGI
jgi:hypothetical protein